jgi:hypothetical protein
MINTTNLFYLVTISNFQLYNVGRWDVYQIMQEWIARHSVVSSAHNKVPSNLIYKDECLFVCLFYGTYKNSHFWTDLNQTLHTSPSWSGRDRRVCMDPKFSTSSTFRPFFFGSHCRIMSTRWLPARPFSAIPLYPWFQLVFAWRHRHDVVADGGVIRGSLISVILVGVLLTSFKWRRSRQQSHPPQRRIPYSGGCLRHITDITFNRATGPSAILAPVSVTYRKSRLCRRQLRVPSRSVLHCR